MKFNIKPSDGKYIVNEDKRTVVCVIDHTKDLFRDFANENFVLTSLCDKNFKLDEKLAMPDRFIGVAKCSEEDEWDVGIGKLVAFSRAKDKINRSFFKRATIYVKYLDRAIDDAVEIINNIGNKLAINTEHRHDLIESLIGRE